MNIWPAVFRSPRLQRYLPDALLRMGSTQLLRAHLASPGRGTTVALHNVAPPPADNRLNMALAPRNFAAQVRQWRDTARLTGDLPRAGEALLTIDDASAGVFRHALPVLRECGVPAVLFVAPWFIGRAEAFWWDALYRWLATLPRDGSVHALAGETFTAGAGLDVPALFYRLLARLWDRPPQENYAKLQAAGITTAPADDDWRPMTWGEVRACAAAGVRIGCHGFSHRRFAALGETALTEELAAAEALFASELKMKPDLLAAPYGAPGTWNATTVAVAQRRGYRALFLYGDRQAGGDLTADRISVRNTPYVHPKTYEGTGL